MFRGDSLAQRYHENYSRFQEFHDYYHDCTGKAYVFPTDECFQRFDHFELYHRFDSDIANGAKCTIDKRAASLYVRSYERNCAYQHLGTFRLYTTGTRA